MKLSVIILCYNFEKYIEQCILSVVSQKTNFDFEILIRDDFSTDKSVENIERIIGFYPNINLIRATENWGSTKNYLYLLKEAKGEYVALIDGDDYWIDTYKLQKQVDFLDENSDYILTFTGFIEKDLNNNYLQELGCWMGLPNSFLCEVNSSDLWNSNYVTFGKVWRNNKDILKEWIEDLPFADWPINYELSKLGKIRYLDFPSGIYRVGSGNYNSLDYDEMIRKNNIVKEKMILNTN